MTVLTPIISLFTYIVSLWRESLKIGYHKTGPGLIRARLMLLNALVMIVAVSVVLFSIGYALIGYQYYYGPLYFLPVGASVFILNANGYFRWAQTCYFFGAFFVVSYWCYEGRGNGNEIILIGLATTSTLIFERRISIIFSNVLCGVMFVSYKFYHLTTPFIPDPHINYNVIPTIILLSTVAVISFQIAFFRELAKHYDRKLKVKYDELKVAQAELKSNNEEINSMNKKLHKLTGQLENMVSEKKSELQSYINAVDVHLYSCINDLQGNFLSINDQLLVASGYSREELIGSHYSILTTPEHQQQHVEKRRSELFAGKAWRGEVEHRNKQGELYWFDCVVIPLMDSNGVIRRFLSIGLPATERKLNEMLREKTHSVLESIAFKASHKISGPMARIKGLANLIQMDVLKEEELKLVARNFSDCSDELSVAVSELVNFVYDNQESLSATGSSILDIRQVLGK